MKRRCFFVALALAFLATAAVAGAFTVTSPNLKENGTLPLRYVYNGFGCVGQNISPALSWQGAPAGTKSFAITVYDPDAPTGSGWWHWVVFNIPKNVHSVAANSGNPKKGLLPNGAIQIRSDYGTKGYGGACPPAGDKPHHYQFTVWALNVAHLPLTVNVTGAMVGFNLNAHALAKAEMTVTYGREK